jgi:flagellar biosynthetic protein FliS
MTPAIDRTKLYAQVQIDTSTQPRLICMLHEKCVQLIRHHIDTDSPHQTSDSVQAQNILAQLERSLKQDDEVADGLFFLYDYCYCQLEKADKQSSTSAMSIMSGIRDTFEQLSKN